MQATPITQNTQTVIRRSKRRSSDIDFGGQTVHMIGIGGCGMRAAARLLLQCGAKVSGSDREAFAGLGMLTDFGAKVQVGQQAENIPDGVDLVVHSAAIAESNVELQAARASGGRVIKYAQLIGELMQLRTGVAIAGTHGKSTTTAMCAHLFRVSGLDPSFIIGANVPQLRGGSGVGMGQHFIVEACEFDRSFLRLKPQCAAILNVEADHLDCYEGIDEIISAFAAFAGNVDSDGLIVVNQDDRNALDAVGAAAARVETFGFGADATWRASNLEVDRGRYTFDVTYESLPLFRSSLAIVGRHNVSNALAAVALAWNAGATRESLAEGLRSFEGVDRRMSHRGCYAGVNIVDDYAHHPSEIRVTLTAARDRFAPRRVWVVFQPHQHSRTRILMDDFAGSFELADEVIIPSVYGSRDVQHQSNGDAASTLARRIAANGTRVRHIPSLAEVAAFLEFRLEPEDLVITMGAGDVWKMADDLVGRLQRQG